MDHDKGLDADGHFVREGSLDRVQPEFAGLVDAARAAIVETYGPDRLHSGYLYGSVPRGTARPGRSDLDLLLALHRPPTAADRADADRTAARLDAAHPEVDGVGVLLFDTATLLSEPERYDLGWFLACLCTPLLGPDLAADLPRYRPSSLLARETNGDYPLHLVRWRGGQGTVRGICRVTVRSAFTLVMPRWGGWTSDLLRSAEIAGSYYPERAEQLRTVALAALDPVPDESARRLVTEELGPWLAAEYTAVHGTKAPRP
ncbi:nucleotidyltransferase domain-containing protein [Kitasatospora albolonga]|uniref:nucleotidyltransferase domain-containing protein n=1 Tax=Kitasatospora albolonga TaxID=68173 RepID=UPI0031EB3995